MTDCHCRHQWFQTQTVVEVAVLAKSMTKERVDIQIDKQHLRVVIKDAEGEQEYELDLELYGEVRHRVSGHVRVCNHRSRQYSIFGKQAAGEAAIDLLLWVLQVDPAASKHELLKSKTEIRLKKSAAVKWPTLEKSDQKADPYAKAPTAVPTPVQQAPKPAYPSSFNKRSVDWCAAACCFLYSVPGHQCVPLATGGCCVVGCVANPSFWEVTEVVAAVSGCETGFVGICMNCHFWVSSVICQMRGC